VLRASEHLSVAAHSSFGADPHIIHSRRSFETSICAAPQRTDRCQAARRSACIRRSKEKFMTVTKLLGVAAVGAMLALAAPAERAQAMSLASPGAAATVAQGAAVQQTTEVRWHRHWHPRRHWHPHRWHRRHW
jgi:hypothetical protein